MKQHKAIIFLRSCLALFVVGSLVSGCHDHTQDATTTEPKLKVAAQAVTPPGPNCTSAGDPTLGVNIGYSCTGALAAATFTHALCACGTIQDSNSLTTDGFDSSHGGPNGGLGADVAANTGVFWSTTSSIGGTLWTPGNVTSSNPSTVRGDLRLGGTLSGSGTFTVNGNAYVVQTLPSFARVLGRVNRVTSVATPCNCSNQVPIATITAAHRAPNNDDALIGLSPTAFAGNNPATLDLPCGNYYLTQINAALPLTIKVHGHTALYVDGNLQASQSLTLQIDAAASLDLFVAGTFSAAQSLVLGSPTTPKNCRAYVAGTNFVTSGNVTYGCNVYAPNALITLANNAVVSGALFANNIQVSGNATVHYDTTITGSGGECCSSSSCNDSNPCTTDTCNADGTCTHTAVANGTACNDGNACTQTDTCQAGTCTGANPKVCAASDQCHTAGLCDQATGTCSNPAKTNGTACNDGNGCTQSDTCQAGICTGANPKVCAASDQCHVAGTCDQSTGTCSNPNKANGTTCNDGNACTQTDMCQAGVCTGANPVVCAASDQCHVAGTCDSATGACSNPAATNGTLCNDGNACTQTDACQAGLCAGANPVVCAASDQCHVAGSCNAATGTCSNPAKPDGSACNDGNACTQTDACQAGTCSGTNPKVCVASDQCHAVGTCDQSTGTCSNPAKPDGSVCNDGNACTETDACQAGTCTGTNPKVCAALDQCHAVGICDQSTGTCSNPAKPDGSPCNDGNACSQTDVCQAGTCTGTNPIVCITSDQCHDAGSCDQSTGKCSNPAKPDGATCNDDNACTQSDACQAGSCTGTNPIVCTALDQCHDAGSCDQTTGTCSNPAKPDGATCNDGNACTQTDACQSGSCTGTNPVTCTASDQCHDPGSCDQITGTCSNPAKPNGATCNDGNACTQTDACQSGSCTGTNPVTCTASDQCHDAGSCDQTTGTCSNPAKSDGTACNDSNACTQTDACQSGSCTGTNPVTCTASDQCHDLGSCNRITGTCSNPAKPDGATCNDGNACTQTDACQSGACTGANPVTCTASDQCHDAGSCDQTTGTCSNPAKPDGTACSDGNACTQTDACQSGTCAGTNPVTCGAPDQCHDAGSCDPSSGQCSNPAKANGSTCNDGNTCTGSDICQNGSCSGTNPVVCTAQDVCHDAGSCDTATGVCSNPVKPMCEGGLPPDPVLVAPPLDRTVVTTVYQQTQFLYAGSPPIQTGVSAGTIDPKRVCELHGQVSLDDGSPEPGTTITVVGHGEFGQTKSRLDGRFDLVVNGGGPITVDYQKQGYFPVQRTITCPWQQYVTVPEVILVPPDPVITTVAANSVSTQIARGSVVTDEDGTRQPTVVFPPGTQATAVMPDGSTRPLDTMSVRITEYTVGENGDKRMPGDLPPNSAYTHAFEVNADEALAAGATQITFNQPVVYYVDNFLNFPAGIVVPVGSYQRSCGNGTCASGNCSSWVPSQNGIVINIMSVSGGAANIDSNGDGLVDSTTVLSAAGITPAELQTLAQLYAPGKSIWRAPLPHFSAWDCNWGFGPPPDASQSTASEVVTDATADCRHDSGGGLVDTLSQTVAETQPIVGTPYNLVYQSDHVEGRESATEILIPLSAASIPASLKRIDLEVNVACNTLTKSFPPSPNLSYKFKWNGRDCFGRQLQGAQSFGIHVGYVYDGVYQKVARFGYNGNGMPITGNKTRQEVTLWRDTTTTPSTFDVKPLGLGGWNVDIHHAYDPSGTLYKGDGTTRRAQSIGSVINRFAGGGTTPAVSATNALNASFGDADALAVAADGSVYVIDHYYPAIYRIFPDGTMTRVAGTGTGTWTPNQNYNGDEIPATQATINPYLGKIAMARECDGGFYFVDMNNYRIRYVDANGIIHTVMGNGQRDRTKDGVTALQNSYFEMRDVAVAPDGSLYLCDDYGLIVHVSRDGIVSYVAGVDKYLHGGGSKADGIPATQASITPTGIALGPDGSIIVLDADNSSDWGRISRIGTDGILRIIAGGGPTDGSAADGIPAKQVRVYAPQGIALGADGTIYYAQRSTAAPELLIAILPNGTLKIVAGAGTGGNGAAAKTAVLSGYFNHLALAPDGSIYTAESAIFRRIASPLPAIGPVQLALGSDDGRELYVFDGGGRHLSTRDTTTGATRYAFGYDFSGRLSSITDAAGNITNIQHDTNWNPTSIIAPRGQTTRLDTDSGGYLASISNPANETVQMTYLPDQAGLLATFADAAGDISHFGYDDVGRLIHQDNQAGGAITLSSARGAGLQSATQTTALGTTSSASLQSISPGVETRVTTLSSGLQTIRKVNGTITTTLPNGTVTTSTPTGDPRFGLASSYAASISVSAPSGLSYQQSMTRTVSLSNGQDPLSLASQTDTVITDPSTSAKFTSTYTASTKTWTMTTPAYRTLSMTVDSLGRLASTRVGSLASETFSFDSNGQLASIKQSARTRSFGYDSAGMLASVTDPMLHPTAYVRDAAGRITQQTFADGQVLQLTYDANGGLASLTPPGRPAHLYAHTAIGRLQQYAAPAVDGSGSSTTQYIYDADGRLNGVSRPDGTSLNVAYDTAARISSVTMPGGLLAYTYSATTGRLVGAVGPNEQQVVYGYDGVLPTDETWSGAVNGKVHWGYDKFLKPITESVNGGNVVSYAYDADGLLTKVGMMTLVPDSNTGIITNSTLRSVNDALTYDTYGQRATYTAKFQTTALLSATYTRDGLGRIATKSETIHGQTSASVYTYDLRNRLTDVKLPNGTTIAHCDYDANGNRTGITAGGTTSAATYDAQDRLLSQGSVTYAYGADGELRTKTDTSTASVTRYTYDALGNLTHVELPDGRIIDYVIDAAGRRVAKKINGAIVQQWLYRNATKPAAEFDGAGNLVSRFVYADAAIGDDAADQSLMERLGMARSSRHSRVDRARPSYLVRGGKTLRILTDHLGSPRLVVDADSGQIVQELQYDDWGNVQVNTASEIQPFGFAGGLYDPDTKLVRFGARDYDPQTGRFTSKEPVKTAGLPNLYEYAGSDPVNNIDVDGLAKFDCSNGQEVACQDKAALLDSLCGPDAQGELHCYMQEFTYVTERTLKGFGPPLLTDTDTTSDGIAGTSGRGQISTSTPSLTIGGDYSADNGGGIGTGTGAVVANQPPTVSVGSTKTVTMTLPNNTVTLNGTVSDDGLPKGFGVSILWYTASGPAKALFSNPWSPVTTVTFPAGAPGTYTLTLAATDGEFVVQDTFTAVVLVPNDPPVVSVSGPSQADVNTWVSFGSDVVDDGRPNHTLTMEWSKLSGPGIVTFDSPNKAATDVVFDEIGSYVLQYSVSDSALTTTVQVPVKVLINNQRPVVNAGLDQSLTSPNKSTTLAGTMTDDGLPEGSTVALAWSQVSGPALAKIATPSAIQTAVEFPYPGSYILRLSASDSALTGYDDVEVDVTAPTGSSAPVAQLLSLTDDVVVTKPTPVTGTVTDGAWALTYRLGGRDDVNTPWHTIASGTGPTTGTLGTFDPTQLLNGIYTVRLSSKTSTGESETTVGVTVDGRMKVGNFTLTFLDFDVPVSGIPMQLLRTYDSRDTRPGDFGAGWNLALRNVRVEKGGIIGAHWVQNYIPDDWFPQYCLETVGSAMVTITMPNGRVYRFRPVAYPHCQTLNPLTAADVSWENVSDPDNPTISLQAINDHSVFVQGPAVGPVQFINSDFEVWDPRLFTLTTEDGTVYGIDQDHGLKTMTDRNGNYLAITDQGITYSAGNGISFVRGDDNRIIRIVDPGGQVLLYDYDWQGDLIASRDRDLNQTKYTYSAGHYLETINDPLGRQPIRNEYDASGRLVKHTDALGHSIVYTHLLAKNQEQIADRLGNLTVYDYNDSGDIIRKTDALGAVWTYTYDSNGNQTTATDPLGNTTTKTFTWHDTLLSETNALGEQKSHTYDRFERLLTTTDPLGNLIVQNDYNVFTGNLATSTDAHGAATSYSYDNQHRLIREIDAQGNTTQYLNDTISGNVLSKTDPLGNVTSYTYDGENRKLTETVTRKIGGATESLVTSYTYNNNGRLLKTTYPDGSTTYQEWNPNGQRTATVDTLGRRTTYDYDELGRLSKTTYPDGGTETIAYDAENRRTSRTNPLGQITKYAYDAIGRLTTTTNPDNTTTTNTYDTAGNLISTTNETGKTTTYAYDATNRRISTTDPLGNATYTIYDPDGRQIETIAPDHTSTEYTYNDAGDLIETDFADNTHSTAEFDDLGRQISKTDELGHVTHFGYDALGRLTSVTDAANQVTRYAYDEQGNQITQTDANGHITHFAYDKRGRMTDRQLPDGTTEHRNYDTAGQLLTRADFAGRVTQYTYDASGRLLTRKYPDNSLVTFTYDAAGQRKTVTDARGLTTYNYDNRGHVASLVYPGASELDYAYDPRGMRSGITAKIGTRTLTTTTGFDDAGRLTTLTDPLSRAYGAQYDANGNRTSLSYPNTQGTSYTYDTRGRLTGLVTKEPGANGNIAQSYAYTLDSAGKRTRIEESDGTVRQYGYDSVDRLTSEAVSGPTNYSYAFGYDPVGNRLTQTSTGNHPGTVNYSYDNRDQLSHENGTAYSYDNNGNLTAKTGEATYTWDFENRLKRVSLQDGSIVDHLYDADGNRVQTKVTPAGGGTATVTNFLVDTTGNLSQVVAETDSAGALKALYVRAYDELLAVLRPTGTSTWATRYVHVDGLGSIRVLTDEIGVVTDTRDYEAFGVRNESAGSDPLAFGFAGEAFDNISKLAYHRARWMDPRSGRFVGMDPKEAILQQPGKFHLFAYAGGNPISNVDPSGREFDLVSVEGAFVGMNVLAAIAGTYRLATDQSAVPLKEIGQTGGADLKLLAIRIFPLASIGMEAVIMNKAVQIIEETKMLTSDPNDAFGRLYQKRNSSYENSQDLPLAAAEHFFLAKAETRKDSYWGVAVNMIVVFGYDGIKAFVTPLAIGVGRYAVATNPTYPATPTTAASLVCATWGIFEGVNEAHGQ